LNGEEIHFGPTADDFKPESNPLVKEAADIIAAFKAITPGSEVQKSTCALMKQLVVICSLWLDPL
jgi:hypothetical protein